TTVSNDPEEYARRMEGRVKAGYTFLKMDLGIQLLRGQENMVTAPHVLDRRDFSRIEHPFTGIQITDRGIARLAEFVAAVRERVGYEIPLAADHFGHMGVNSCIRLGRALERYQIAWLEDLVPWFYTDM